VVRHCWDGSCVCLSCVGVSYFGKVWASSMSVRKGVKRESRPCAPGLLGGGGGSADTQQGGDLLARRAWNMGE
jgi:hypothetical protein